MSASEIRESEAGDGANIEQLYAASFPEEDLVPLVHSLLDHGEGILSLVAIREDAIVGHVCFTICGVEGGRGEVALLGPLAVSPSAQHQSIGTNLVENGLNQLKNNNVTKVLVLGDPVYYGRFGFEPEDKITPPYALPDEWKPAWQSLNLFDTELPLAGTLSVPDPWRDQALWSE